MHNYGLPESKFMIIPNFLPRWWIGDSFNLGRQMQQWKEQHTRPHLAFVCSMNHFDLQNKNGRS